MYANLTNRTIIRVKKAKWAIKGQTDKLNIAVTYLGQIKLSVLKNQGASKVVRGGIIR